MPTTVMPSRFTFFGLIISRVHRMRSEVNSRRRTCAGIELGNILTPMVKVPVIDISPFTGGPGSKAAVAREIGQACQETGFFYVVGHGVEEGLQTRLEKASAAFFARPEAEKMQVAMAKGGRAWRGYFPVKGELTSGKPDLKEGIYFGQELGPTHPDVQAGLPLHGPNLFPAHPPEMRQVVLDYIAATTRLGHHVMEAISISLGLPGDYFSSNYTASPLVLFRIFNYPPPSGADAEGWGVGEHTDYGLLTILKQDDSGGLEVRARSGEWIAAPPVARSFVCNIGDMLDRLTRGHYRSTPHRVRNPAGRNRLSYPTFFDPSFHAEVKPLPAAAALPLEDDKHQRWDGASVHEFRGTYGDYLIDKVSKVFPALTTVTHLKP
jgi:isopenicillin N synthase-like dioxygenase